MVNHFSYAARDGTGGRVSGEIVALNTEEAIGALQEAGVYVTHIEASGFQGKGLSGHGRVALASHEKVFLLESWARLLEAGLPMYTALSYLQTSIKHPSVRRALKRTEEMMGNGFSFADALGASGLIPPSWVGVLEIGQKRGDFIGPLKILAQSSEQARQTIQRLVSALVMPFVLLSLVFVWIWIFLSMLGPEIGRCIVDITGSTHLWWNGLARFSSFSMYIIAVPVLALCFLGLMIARGNRADALMGAIPTWTPIGFPLIGPLVSKIHLIMVCSELQLQMEAGIPIMTALTTLIHGIPRLSLRRDLQKVYSEILGGTPVWQALAGLPMMPQETSALLAAGEVSGKLPELLGVVAREACRDLEAQAILLSVKIRSFTVIMSGIMVGILIAAVMAIITSAFDPTLQRTV